MPQCPIHHVEMEPSTRGGGYFCKKKMPDGSWCKEKAGGVAPAAVPGPPLGSIALPTPSPNYMESELAAECMKFVVGIKDAPPQERTELIQDAVNAFKAFKALL